MEVLGSLVDDNRAVVMVTHDAELADRADRRIRMRDGEILEESSQLGRDARS